MYRKHKKKNKSKFDHDDKIRSGLQMQIIGIQIYKL